MAPSKNKKKSNNKKTKTAKGKNNNGRNKPRVKEIVFDPEARRDYLRGFSERKRQRRAYGLAMQKVKDRKAKLESRKELRQAELERVEEAERLKEEATRQALEGDEEQLEEEEEEENCKNAQSSSDDNDNITDDETEKKDHPKDKTTTTYHDEATLQQWGGDVVVTTSMNILDSDEEEEEKKEPPKKQQRASKKKTHDAQQEYAGNVEKFLAQLKQKMPAKNAKKAAVGQKHKGKHGAAGMKGIGGATVLKIAQKALARSKVKGGGKKGKR